MYEILFEWGLNTLVKRAKFKKDEDCRNCLIVENLSDNAGLEYINFIFINQNIL